MKANKTKMPPEVADMRWWGKTRKRHFAKIRTYADGYTDAFTQPNLERLKSVRLFDTSARDGMQMRNALVPSVTSQETTKKNKLSLIMMLAKMGVPIIEAGFAAASNHELEIIRAARRMVEEQSLDTKIVALGMTINSHIDAIAESGAHIAHIFSSGSAPHTWVKFGKLPKDTLDDIRAAVTYANQCGFSEIVLSLEDSICADPEHLVTVGKMAADIAGDKVRYNIPDTVGITDPVHMFALVRYLQEKVGLPLQVHCHNDRGLAAMNSIAAALAGASEIHVTMHGIGERAGNAPLEEVVGFFATQFGINMIKTEMLASVSRCVEQITGIPKKVNAPYLGRLAWWHESGAHGNAVMKGRQIGYEGRDAGIDGGSIYAPCNPAVFGMSEQVGVGPVSGKSNVILRMKDNFGVAVDDETADRIIAEVKERSATTAVSDADLVLIAYKCMSGRDFKGITVMDCKATSCMKNGNEASIEIDTGDGIVRGTGKGNGPIDAAISSVKHAMDRVDVKMEDYNSKAIGTGSDATALCTMTVSINGSQVDSSNMDKNSVNAAVIAFVKGINALGALEEMRTL